MRVPSGITRRVIGVFGALTLVGALAPLAATAAPNGAVRTEIGAAPQLPRGAVRLGTVAPTQELKVTVVLAPRDLGGLEAATKAVSDPRSPSFREFLSTEEIRSRFGPSLEARASVSTWLASQGFDVLPGVSTFLLAATAPAAKVEQAFGTPISTWRLSGGRTVRASVRAPSVPTEIASSIQAVLGLSDVRRLTSGAHKETSNSAPRALAPSSACPGAAGVPGGHPADQVATMYGFNDLYAHGHDGTGATIAFYELAAFDASDIAAYATCYGLSASGVSVIPVNGGTTIADDPVGVGEVTSDIEVSLGLSPGTSIKVYETSQNDPANFLALYQRIADDNTAQVVSTSWGVCEGYYVAPADRSEIDAENTVFSQMALQGQTMVAASGDLGSSTCALPLGVPNPAVWDPASQPFVTGVGGTNITTASTPPVEEVWNESGANGDGAGWPVAAISSVRNSTSTGGMSMLWPMPTYQVGADTSGISSAEPCGVSSGFCREVPDVSAMAEGYPIYGTAGDFSGAGWVSIGGTSLAAPLWASVFAIGAAASATGRLGFANPSLYQLAAQVPSSLGDVTMGMNDMFTWPTNYDCTYGSKNSQPCYRATKGYDMTTGLGTPRADQLVHLLSGTGPVFTSTTFASWPVLQNSTRTLTVFGGTGPMHFARMSGSLPPGVVLNTSTGVLSGIPTRTGSFAVTFRVTDSATPAPGVDSVSLTLTIARSDVLQRGSVLRMGTQLISNNQKFKMIVTASGAAQIVEIATGRVAFATPQAGSGARLQISGNALQLRRADGSVAWSTGSGAGGAVNAKVLDDGRLEVLASFGPTWISTFGLVPAVSLVSGVPMTTSGRLVSRYGSFRLTLNASGTLAVQRADNGAVRWSVTASGATKLVVQSDGNVVLKNSTGTALWSTGTPSPFGTVLTLTDSGVLKVSDRGGRILWSR